MRLSINTLSLAKIYLYELWPIPLNIMSAMTSQVNNTATVSAYFTV